MQIIGQQELLHFIDTIIPKYPKFSIITGAKGSGKKLIVKYICNKLNIPIIPFDTAIDCVRDVIDLAYQQTEPLCYVCYNADKMSVGAKNCLLKITEEPPNNAYFILTLQNINNTLETIQSRGTVLKLDNYSQQELIDYRVQKSYSGTHDAIIKDICTTTGEVDELFKYDIDAFYTFAQTVAYQIHIPTTGNIFKISKAVKSKQDDGYDPILLFKAVRRLFIQKALETKKVQYLQASNVTTKCLQELSLSNVNTVGTVDNWIMEVRSSLKGI